MAKNIAVIGDAETIKGFSAIGLDIFPCDDNEQAAHLLRNIADGDNYAIIYLTEEVYTRLSTSPRRFTTRLKRTGRGMRRGSHPPLSPFPVSEAA